LRRQAMDRINKMKDPSFSNESPSFLMEGFLFSCFFAMLIFPNMVFSGNHWFQSLHLLKWVTAFVPIALIVLVLWASSFNKRVVFFFSVDFFALIWLAFLVYITLQPLWVPILSPQNSRATNLQEAKATIPPQSLFHITTEGIHYGPSK
jgi:magnesium-transporting ATPase (P-type)